MSILLFKVKMKIKNKKKVKELNKPRIKWNPKLMWKPEIPSGCIFSKCTIHLWDPIWPLINNARYLSLSRWSQETSRSPVRPVAPWPGLSRQLTLLNTFYISKKQIEFYIFNNICVTIYNQWKKVPYTSDAWVGKK